MPSPQKKYTTLVSNTLLFAISNFSSKLLSFFIRPYLSYALDSPDVMGVSSLLQQATNLLIPVVTDPKKAAGALQWAVTEMMKRYRMFAEVGVRDLASYNAKAARTEGMEKMPQVVVVIDELADLMIVSHVELVKGEGGAASAVEGLGVAAAHATGDKCERCWKYSASIGSHPAHPTLCARCASVVEA